MAEDDYPKNFAGITVSEFCGFGHSQTVIAPFGKFNVFAGKNSAGKSNALAAIRRVLGLCTQQKVDGAAAPRKERHKDAGIPTFSLLLRSIDEHSGKDHPVWQNSRSELLKNWPKVDGYYQVKFAGPKDGAFDSNFLDGIVGPEQELWYQFLLKALQAGGVATDGPRRIIEECKGEIEAWKPLYFGPFRQLGAEIDLSVKPKDLYRFVEAEEFEGRHVATLLHHYKSPPGDLRKTLKPLYAKYLDFIRDVFEAPNAEISTPGEGKGIIVSFDGQEDFEIDQVGSGIYQILMIAAACSFVSKRSVFLEEPETHLHPALLRKLANYLIHKTDNQYFLSTHSAALIDTPGASVFHVAATPEKGTQIKAVRCHGARANTCFDLGFRPSDLVQANCVIWVEGPSDRLYIRHWLKLVDKDLQEGAHYSFMFYGGSLHVHLSGEQIDEGEILEDDLLSLVRMSQRSAFVADSDRDSEDAPDKADRLRIKEALEAGHGWAWLTDGREIENYLSPKILEEAVEAVHPFSEYMPPEDSLFGDAVKIRRRSSEAGESCGKQRDFDKLKVAKYIVSSEELIKGLVDCPLRRKVQGLADFIRSSNGLPAK